MGAGLGSEEEIGVDILKLILEVSEPHLRRRSQPFSFNSIMFNKYQILLDMKGRYYLKIKSFDMRVSG